VTVLKPAIECWTCQPEIRGATETHWRIYRGDRNGRMSWSVCGDCAEWSKAEDEQDAIAWPGSFGVLYLPIVQPVMGSEQALAMEAALFAVGRLLLLTPEDRALLQAAQDAAWERVHGKEAA
jgi:hypothetical protein